MQYIEANCNTSDGLSLFSCEWKPETAAKAVVCIVHGLGEHCGRYTHVAAALTSSGYVVMAQDIRGHGKSGGPRGHTPSYGLLTEGVRLLLSEASKRHPGLPCFLYGHSMGGNLVLNYALRYNKAPDGMRQAMTDGHSTALKTCRENRNLFEAVKACQENRNRLEPDANRFDIAGVVATSPWLRLVTEPAWYKLILALVMNELHPSFIQKNGLRAGDMYHDPEGGKAYVDDPLNHGFISARMFAVIRKSGLWALKNASQFPLPLLLMHGGDDRITSPEASRQFSKDAAEICTFKLWEGSYHELHNEPNSGEVLHTVIQWMDRQMDG